MNLNISLVCRKINLDLPCFCVFGWSMCRLAGCSWGQREKGNCGGRGHIAFYHWVNILTRKNQISFPGWFVLVLLKGFLKKENWLWTFTFTASTPVNIYNYKTHRLQTSVTCRSALDCIIFLNPASRPIVMLLCPKKSGIRETLNLSPCADRSTNLWFTFSFNRYQLSHVRFQVLHVMCGVSLVTCHVSQTPRATAPKPRPAYFPGMHSRMLLLP